MLRHRVVRVVVDLAAGDDRHPLVEQAGQRADHAGLRLAALAEEDHVVPGEQRVLELRHHGVLVAGHAGEQRLAGGDLVDRVLANLLLHRARDPARGAEFADRRGGAPAGSRSIVTMSDMAKLPLADADGSGPSQRRDGIGSTAMELPGPWVAAEADDEIRRNGIGLDRRPIATGEVDRGRRCPATGRAPPEVRVEQRAAHVPHPIHARRHQPRAGAVG